MSEQEKTKKWRDTYIASLKQLTSPTQAQKLILELDGNPSRTPRESRDLDTLLRAEEAREKMVAISLRASKIARTAATNREKTKNEIRNKRMIDQGLLVELAQLHERTDAELLGVLLAAASTTDADRWASWAKHGAQRLAVRDAADVAKRAEKAKRKTTEVAPT